jgi:hypothetical protein
LRSFHSFRTSSFEVKEHFFFVLQECKVRKFSLSFKILTSRYIFSSWFSTPRFQCSGHAKTFPNLFFSQDFCNSYSRTVLVELKQVQPWVVLEFSPWIEHREPLRVESPIQQLHSRLGLDGLHGLEHREQLGVESLVHVDGLQDHKAHPYWNNLSEGHRYQEGRQRGQGFQPLIVPGAQVHEGRQDLNGCEAAGWGFQPLKVPGAQSKEKTPEQPKAEPALTQQERFWSNYYKNLAKRKGSGRFLRDPNIGTLEY